MERILIILFILCYMLIQPVSVMGNTDTSVQNPAAAAKPNTEFSTCTKTFPVGVEKLFYLTLSAANEYDYKIKEIQTKSGYIIFETGYRKFLASVIYVSSEKSMLKITPYSGNYDFSPEVVQKVFNYITQYQNTQF